MPIIQNNRPSILALPKSKLALKPDAQAEVPTLNEELQNAIQRGWVKVIANEESEQDAKINTRDDTGKSHPREWDIDYSSANTGTIVIRDRASGRSLSAEIVEKKGEQYFTLKHFGTVKGQQFWPTAQALEQVDAAE